MHKILKRKRSKRLIIYTYTYKGMQMHWIDAEHTRSLALPTIKSHCFCLVACHIEASSSWIKSSHDWLLCGLVKADRLPISCAKIRARDCEMTWPTMPNSSSRQLMRSPPAQGGCAKWWKAPALNVKRRRSDTRRGQGPNFTLNLC